MVCLLKKFRSKLEIDVENDMKELQKILQTEIDAIQRKKLIDLALKIGASIIDLYKGYGDATYPQLIQNIHQALQTKSMIAAVRTTSNYVIVSIILALIAFLSMIATFISKF